MVPTDQSLYSNELQLPAESTYHLGLSPLHYIDKVKNINKRNKRSPNSKVLCSSCQTFRTYVGKKNFILEFFCRRMDYKNEAINITVSIPTLPEKTTNI